jgi:hypothetical protein
MKNEIEIYKPYLSSFGGLIKPEDMGQALIRITEGPLMQ